MDVRHAPEEGPRMTDFLLEVDALRKEFGGLIAVNDVDLTIPRGAIVSLIGPNGAGKTTFFNMITGVYKPTSGRVVFDGRDIAGLPPHTATERGIGRTFQNIRLFQQMTAARERPRRDALPPEGRDHREHPANAEGEARRARRRTNAPASCSTTAGSPAVTTTMRATSRTAISGGSRSPVRSRPSPSSCSWTSPRPG